MRCRLCGRETGDRHSVCWRCVRGLPGVILDRDADPLCCVCAIPDPHRIGGIWWAVDALECRHCGRVVVRQVVDGSSAP